MNAIELQIKVTTTFADMLKLVKEYFYKTISHFDSIQQWLNLRQDKEEPVNLWTEWPTELAKMTAIDTITGK